MLDMIFDKIKDEKERNKRKKWTDEEIDRVRMSPGFYWDSRFYNQVADHIKELQDAVDRLLSAMTCSPWEVDDILDEFFEWREIGLEDPNDNLIGHEW